MWFEEHNMSSVRKDTENTIIIPLCNCSYYFKTSVKVSIFIADVIICDLSDKRKCWFDILL
jgi:hypothetical protein